jgi:hypothetical protein
MDGQIYETIGYQNVDICRIADLLDTDEVTESATEILHKDAMEILLNDEGLTLAFWKCKGTHFPVLSMVAKYLFSICNNSIGMESSFSTAKLIKTKLRNRMSAETFDMSLTCAMSLKAERRKLEASKKRKLRVEEYRKLKRQKIK